LTTKTTLFLVWSVIYDVPIEASESGAKVTTNAVSAALALNHTEPTPYLQLKLPVDPLIDERHCQQISESLRLAGKDWECRKATPTLWKQLPTKPGLYMFVWRPSLSFRLAADPDRPVIPPYILYVGQAGGKSNNNLRGRYKGEYAHYVGADPSVLWSTDTGRQVRQERLQRYLTIVPLEYWWSVIEDRDKILQLERRLNYMLSPPLSRVGRARLITMDAFPDPARRS
jgi:hypothetical protein